MKIGVSSYSYRRLVREGKLDFLGVPAKAKAPGFDILEFSRLRMTGIAVGQENLRRFVKEPG
jgi:hypothetical protein